MAKHWLETPLIIHCDGADGAGYTLCGYATEGETGNEPLTEVAAQINCERCIAVLDFCRRVRPSEVCSPFQRRRPHR